MAKRTLRSKPSTDGSALSTLPDDSQEVGNARTRANDTASGNLGASASKKRKRELDKEEIIGNEKATLETPRKRKQAETEELPVGVDATRDSAEKQVVGKSKELHPGKPQGNRRGRKEEKDAAIMPLAPRTVGKRLFIGAHVSGAGGVHNSVPNSVHIGANAFALFLKSQRKWVNPPLAEAHCTSFHENCKSHTYDQARHVVPHGSYLVNLAHTDKARTEQAYSSFLDDLKRCERLGIKLYNFHPGVANSVNGNRPVAIAHLASNINRAHKETSGVIMLLENMAAGGNVLGSTFEDLRDIINLVEDKTRVGVCLDTCHAFAGGYDLRSPTAFKTTTEDFERIVGFKYLRALHLNDSKAPFASHRDLHANIGTGFLGLRAFHNIVNDSRFEGLPLILETPIDAMDEHGTPLKDEKGKLKEDRGIWAGEIKLLESLVGMDAEGEQFLNLETRLAHQGKPERDRLADQIEKKKKKEEKKSKVQKNEKTQKKNRKAQDGDSRSEDRESPLSDLTDDE